MRPALAALIALLLVTSAAASDLKFDGKTSVTKLMASPLIISVTGTPGLPVALLLDVAPGPTTVLGVSIPIGFTPVWQFISLGTIPPSGTLQGNVQVINDPAFNDLTLYAAAIVFDSGAPSGLDVSNGVDLTVRDRNMHLAGDSLDEYPHFEHTRAFNQGATIELAVEPSRFPEIVGRTGDIYIVAHKDRDAWIADPSLVDAGGGPFAHSFVAGSITDNIVLIDTGTLDADAGIGIGVGYDVVIDLDQNGVLNNDDFIDGYGDEAGLFVVHDLTLPGPLAVTEITYSGGTLLGQNLFFPTDVASMGELPLVIVSHGNGHNYQWYDHIGNHLASYGYVVMSHQNNTGPGIETASTTTLTNTDFFLGNLDGIAGGSLLGHIDVSSITWLGHSRGGEGVVRAYDRVFDGNWVPVNYTLDDIKLVSSIAPTGFLVIGQATPHAVTYHLWTGQADADVNGCASSNIVQTFQIHDRAEQKRLSISLHGVGHGDFHNSTGSVATGPCLVGKPTTHAIIRGYILPLVKHVIEGNLPAKDYLWRQWESFRPISGPFTGFPCVNVDLQYRDGDSAGNLVIDDFQTNSATNLSSSGGAVTATVSNLAEGRPDDSNSDFTNNAADVWNGFTYARNGDSTRALIFDYVSDSELRFDMAAGDQDVSDYVYLSFRAAQAPRHPNTTGAGRDQTFSITLRDTEGASATINISTYGGGIEEPYQRGSCGAGQGWAAEYETVRVRLTDFLHEDSGLDLTSLESVAFDFGPSSGHPIGRLGFDDLQLTTD